MILFTNHNSNCKKFLIKPDIEFFSICLILVLKHSQWLKKTNGLTSKKKPNDLLSKRSYQGAGN